jgi:flagellar biosynthesis protein FliR
MPGLSPLQPIFDQAPVFVLVLFRVAGLLALAPLLGSMVIPARIKVFIALVLSMAVYPLVGPVTAAVPHSWAGLAMGVGHELIIGLSMGFALSLLFSGIEIGVEMISTQMGLSMAQLVDPMMQIETNVLSQFYTLLATLIFVLMNGHLILIRSIAQTFATVPLMGARLDEGVLSKLVSILTASFGLGIRVAGPALIAIFLATLALGFISRTMPQLNILAAGFPINITLALVLMVASLGAVGVLFHDSLMDVLEAVGTLFA